MVSYPTAGDYRDAISHPDFCFADAELKAGQPKTDRLRMPRPVVGNFSAVFRVSCPRARTYAVKCFTRAQSHQHERYAAVGEYLSKARPDWAVDFSYLDHGILVNGRWLPVLKMEWVEATDLLSFIVANISNPASLLEIATRFSELAQDLQARGISHGDLQHGNILVTPEGKLKLVDYDGMYVPGAEQLGPSGETGHRNYQPPQRGPDDFGSHVDRFSSWIIYGSLLALASEPFLWKLEHDDGLEGLLLQDTDFAAPANSATLRRFTAEQGSVPGVLARMVETCVRLDLPSIPSFDPTKFPRTAAAPAAVREDASIALPDWVRDRSRSPSLDQWLPTSGAVWRRANRPDFGRRLTREHAVGVSAAATVLSLAAASAIHVVAPLAATALILGIGGLVWALLAGMYARLPAVAKARSAAADVSAKRHVVRNAAAGVRRLEERISRDAGTTRDTLSRLSSESAAVERAREASFRRLREARVENVAGLQRDKARLSEQEATVRANTLRTLQSESMREFLSRHRIADAGISGLGTVLCRRLAGHGVVTAADFRTIVVRTVASRSRRRRSRYRGPQTRQIVQVVLPTGQFVNVDGIGIKKGTALNRWRRELGAAAEGVMPRTLPQTTEAAISTEFLERRKRLETDILGVQSRGVAEDRAVEYEFAEKRRRASETIESYRRERAKLEHSLTRELADARIDLDYAQQRLSISETKLSAYRLISPLAYFSEILCPR